MKKGYVNPMGKNETLTEGTITAIANAENIEWSGITVKSLGGGTFVTTEGDIVTLDEAGMLFDDVFIPMDEE